jgi:beta-glucosidase
MRERTRLLIVAAAVSGAAVATPASHALTADQQCQRAIASAGARIFRRSAAILASCERKLVRGALPAGTDCLADPATRQKRVDLAATVGGRIGAKCTDADAAALLPGGDCAGVQTSAALVGCIGGSHTAAADGLVATASGAGGALAAPASRCQTTALLQTRRFANARLRVLQRCKRNPPPDLLPGTDCTADPDTASRIAARRMTAGAKIAADCDAAALAEARFGMPCDVASDGGSLAECLLTAAESAGDDALAAEFPDTGFCGDAAAAVEQRIDGLVAQMTLDEKLEQMHGNDTIDGGWRTPGLDRLEIPGLGMIDGGRGVGTYGGNATCFPVGMARAATWDPALEERVGEAIGAEARAKGASVILAPVVNNLRHPRWGRAQETYGEDTLLLGRMGVGFVRGAQQHVIANPKHYAANSIEDTRFSVDVSIDERTLREVYLPHFRMTVQQAHAGSVMSAYNLVNGEHCGENVHLLHDVLKGDWNFQGFVESDWILGTRSTVPSANAGLDIEMPAPVYYGQPLADAVAGGQVSEDTIDGAVRRIVRSQLCFRLDSDPPQVDPTQVESTAHIDLALEAAHEAIALLKNANAALPLDRSAVHSIAVVGPLAAMANLGDHGSSDVAPSFAVAPLDGILAAAGGVTVNYVPSPSLSPSDQTTVAAADAAVVVVGLTSADEGEGLVTHGDRDSLALPAGEDQLVADVAALNPRTIVVLEGSGALLMPWVDSVSAILMAWYPGQVGGNAIADVLFGDVNPSGKLPMSFPVAESDLPPFDNVDLAVTYGYYHGYRYLDRNGVAPLFPFGFGLSYTTFQYSNLTLAPTTASPYDHVRVTADVTNTGAVAGDEIAELYVGYEGSSVDRAVSDLKGFARVHLEPGETRTVAFDVRAADLAFWNTAAGAWEVEPITYDVRVGPSSRDLPLTGSFAIAPAP